MTKQTPRASIWSFKPTSAVPMGFPTAPVPALCATPVSDRLPGYLPATIVLRPPGKCR
jgi:hypothetical protein